MQTLAPLADKLLVVSLLVEGDRGWKPGNNGGGGSLWEVGEERAGDGIPKRAGAGRNRT